MGIIQKRKGEVEAAINSYKSALKTDPYSFFPNYNLAVVLAGESQYKGKKSLAVELSQFVKVRFKNSKKFYSANITI